MVPEPKRKALKRTHNSSGDIVSSDDPETQQLIEASEEFLILRSRLTNSSGDTNNSEVPRSRLTNSSGDIVSSDDPETQRLIEASEEFLMLENDQLELARIDAEIENLPSATSMTGRWAEAP